MPDPPISCTPYHPHQHTSRLSLHLHPTTLRRWTNPTTICTLHCCHQGGMSTCQSHLVGSVSIYCVVGCWGCWLFHCHPCHNPFPSDWWQNQPHWIICFHQDKSALTCWMWRECRWDGIVIVWLVGIVGVLWCVVWLLIRVSCVVDEFVCFGAQGYLTIGSSCFSLHPVLFLLVANASLKSRCYYHGPGSSQLSLRSFSSFTHQNNIS